MKKTQVKEKMMAVLKEVKLFEIFENQGGLRFQLNEGAKNLSGGQRQRLALARALLRESDVYIFDGSPEYFKLAA